MIQVNHLTPLETPVAELGPRLPPVLADDPFVELRTIKRLTGYGMGDTVGYVGALSEAVYRLACLQEAVLGRILKPEPVRQTVEQNGELEQCRSR